MIGDPREAGERVLLDEAAVAVNARALEKQIKEVLGKELRFEMVNNADWLLKLELVPFLRDIGKHFTVNDLIKRDLIKKRLDTPDERIEKYLKMYTFMTLEEITELAERHAADPAAREAQETLASQVTELVHGPAAAAQACAATDALYGDTPFHELTGPALEVALAEAHSVKLSKSALTDGVSLAEALVSGGLASSKGDARRLIEGKGITLSGLPITDPDQKIYPGDLTAQAGLSGGHALIRRGRQGVLILKVK